MGILCHIFVITRKLIHRHGAIHSTLGPSVLMDTIVAKYLWVTILVDLLKKLLYKNLEIHFKKITKNNIRKLLVNTKFETQEENISYARIK